MQASSSSSQLILSQSSAFVVPDISSSSKSGANEIKCNPHRNGSPLIQLTQNVVSTYKSCNSSFKPIHKLPRRILTQPSEAVLNNGLDNEESNLICRVHDVLECATAKYIVLDMLGCGTFGQVFRCQRDGSKDVVAVKVIKNKPAYHAQGQLEANIARLLNQKFDVKDDRHIVRLLDQFEFNGHICLVFELLSMSLLDILTQNQFRGLPLNVVQRFTRQILSALVTFQDAGVIHCDLKPENILLSPAKTSTTSSSTKTQSRAGYGSSDDMLKLDMNKASLGTSMSGGFLSQLAPVPEGSPVHDAKPEPTARESLSKPDSLSSSGNTTHAAESPAGTAPVSGSSGTGTSNLVSGSSAAPAPAPSTRNAIWSDVKVIDLGSACFEGQTMYSYIQSRFYRSPEVLLGVPYNGSIDMWSLACVCAEMYLGLPLFPGVSQHNQLTRIVEMFGSPPDYLIDGKNGFKYFTYIGNTDQTKTQAADDDDFELSRQQEVKHRGVRDVGPSSSSSAQPVKSASSSTPILALNESAGQKVHKSSKYRLKTAEEYARETKTEVPQLRKYLRYNRLEDIILKYPLVNKSKLTSEQKREEMVRRHCFLNFLQGLFNVDPFQRWTAKQAANHPFVTNSLSNGSFAPLVDPKVNDRKLAYLLQIQQRRESSKLSSQQPMTKPPIAYSKPNPSASNLPSVSDDGSAQEYTFQALERRLSEPVYKSSSSQLLPTSTQYQSNDPVGLQRGRQVSPESLTPKLSENAPGSEEPSPTVQQAAPLSHLNHPHLQRRNTGEQMYTPTKDVAGAPLSSQPILSMQRQQPDNTANHTRAFTMGLGSRTMSFPGEDTLRRQQEAALQQQQMQMQQQQQMYHQQQQQQMQQLKNPGQLNYQQQQQQYLQQQQQYLQDQQLSQQATSWSQTGAPASQIQSGAHPSMQTVRGSKSYASLQTQGESQHSPSSPTSIYVGSLPTNPGNYSDFGQALIRPEMDEQRYLRSQQQQLYMQQQQQQQMMMGMQQQQARGVSSSYAGIQPSNSSGNLRRYNHGITSVMGGGGTTPRSYENRSRTFLSQMMGSLRGSRTDVPKSRFDDELNQSRHGARDRRSDGAGMGQDELDYSNHNGSLSGMFDEPDRMLNMSTHSSASLDRYFSGSAHGVSAHGVSGHGDRVGSTHGDRYLNMSTHSMSSVTSADFPIVNRTELAAELERQRAGERDAHMREQVSEVERAANVSSGTTISSFWPFNTFRLSGSSQTPQSPSTPGQSRQQRPSAQPPVQQSPVSSSWASPRSIPVGDTSITAAPTGSSTAIPVPLPVPIATDISPRTESSRGSIISTPPPASKSGAVSVSPSTAQKSKSLHGEEDPDSDPFFT